jgi:hypothetical protein
MADLLASLAARSLGTLDSVQPRRASYFERVPVAPPISDVDPFEFETIVDPADPRGAKKPPRHAVIPRTVVTVNDEMFVDDLVVERRLPDDRREPARQPRRDDAPREEITRSAPSSRESDARVVAQPEPADRLLGSPVDILPREGTTRVDPSSRPAAESHILERDTRQRLTPQAGDASLVIDQRNRAPAPEAATRRYRAANTVVQERPSEVARHSDVANPPQVSVSIGRIEVRAATPPVSAPAVPPPMAAPSSPQMSLRDYLERSRRRRP